MKSNFVIIFDFKTYFNPKIQDLTTQLNFIPFKGMNIYISDEIVKLPKSMDNRGWFEVADVDYLLADNVFIISLKETGGYES